MGTVPGKRSRTSAADTKALRHSLQHAMRASMLDSIEASSQQSFLFSHFPLRLEQGQRRFTSHPFALQDACTARCFVSSQLQ